MRCVHVDSTTTTGSSSLKETLHLRQQLPAAFWICRRRRSNIVRSRNPIFRINTSGRSRLGLARSLVPRRVDITISAIGP